MATITSPSLPGRIAPEELTRPWQPTGDACADMTGRRTVPVKAGTRHRTSRQTSRAGHHEPPAVVEDVAAAELGDEARAVEEALVDAVARPVVERALLPLLARLAGRVDDHELVAHAPRRLQE